MGAKCKAIQTVVIASFRIKRNRSNLHKIVIPAKAGLGMVWILGSSPRMTRGTEICYYFSMNERTDCVFCLIANGKMKSDIIYQDDEIIAFPDINPLAPTHILIVPRKHIPSLVELAEGDTPLIGDMAKVANRLAREKGIAESGYRLVMNCGREGGQGVPHVHMHLLGGRQLGSKLG